MPGTLMPVGLHHFFTNAGAVAASHRLFSYTAGTSTKVSLYTDEDLSVAHSNPITMNSAGHPPSPLFGTPGVSYKLVFAPAGSDDPPSSPLWTVDEISAVPPGSTSADADVSGTAGEALAASDCCYLSDGSGGTTSGRWYKTDADAVASSTAAQPIGFATAAISTGASGTLRVSGRVTGLTGLVAGTLYYASATAGALTSSAPTNARVVGRADSTTTLDIIQSEPDASATLSGLVTATAQTITGAKTFASATTFSSTTLHTGVATFTPLPLGVFGYARNAADDTVNNSTTLVNVTDLSFAVVANAEYHFRFVLKCSTADSTTEFDFALTGPAAPTGIIYGVYGSTTGAGTTAAAVAFGTEVRAVTSGTAEEIIVLEGYLRNGANAGTVQLQFAQAIAAVANTIVRAESFLIYTQRA